MTERDLLTGVMSRRAFFEQLQIKMDSARAEGSRLALLYLDVDHMKHFNGHNGHRAGDTVLVGLAAALQSTLTSHQLLARVGGDEFAILLPGATEVEAVECAERVREVANTALVRRQVEDCGESGCLGPAKLTVCVGVTIFEPAMTVEDLMRDVEDKIERAKCAGRNRVWI